MGAEISATAALDPVFEGGWISSEAIRIVGMRLATNMTVLRLGDGELLLHSPVPLTLARRSAVDALGRVAHLYAPNTIHHLWLAEWARAYPEARVHAPAALAKNDAALVQRRHDVEPEPSFAGVLDEHHVDGFRLAENVLFYRPARALIVADLVHNIGRPDHFWTKFYSSAMGFYDRVALSRAIRWTAFVDRRAARRSLDALLRQPFDYLLVGHGSPVAHGARDALAAAFDWLPAASTSA